MWNIASHNILQINPMRSDLKSKLILMSENPNLNFFHLPLRPLIDNNSFPSYQLSLRSSVIDMRTFFFFLCLPFPFYTSHHHLSHEIIAFWMGRDRKKNHIFHFANFSAQHTYSHFRHEMKDNEEWSFSSPAKFCTPEL